MEVIIKYVSNFQLKKFIKRFFKNILILLILCTVLNYNCKFANGIAIDCLLKPTGENYIGVRYKALLVENELSESYWVLLFAGSGFTSDGEYQPHYIDLMIKASWADIYDDPLCSKGFPQPKTTLDTFTIEFGISDYEDVIGIYDNDIAAMPQNASLFPRKITNIDSIDPSAPDKIMAEYQVDKGGYLEGKIIEVSFVRKEVTTLPQDENYYMDPDLVGELLGKPCSQDDILYRRWEANLYIPSLSVNSSVDFFINAEQGDKLLGTNTHNFLWENPGRAAIESDKYKVIIFDIETKLLSGEWRKSPTLLIDVRAPYDELPINENGTFTGGFRKVNFKGEPALEASFGYGYTDYVIDKDPTIFNPVRTDWAELDLTTPLGLHNDSISVEIKDNQGLMIPNVNVFINDQFMGKTDNFGEYNISSIYSGYHFLKTQIEGYKNGSTLLYIDFSKTTESLLVPIIMEKDPIIESPSEPEPEEESDILSRIPGFGFKSILIGVVVSILVMWLMSRRVLFGKY